MKVCQYEFQFQNEFMSILEKELGELFCIPVNQDNMTRIDVENQSFICRKKDACNFMIFSANRDSYIYLLIIRCEEIYEEDVKRILLNICEEIEEDYGENHRKEVRDVFNEENNRFSIIEEKYGIKELFNI